MQSIQFNNNNNNILKDKKKIKQNLITEYTTCKIQYTNFIDMFSSLFVMFLYL